MKSSRESSRDKKMSRREALELLSSKISPIPSTNISVRYCAGKAAARTIKSPVSLPEHARSAMDGYAIMSSQTTNATPDTPAQLKFSGEIRPSHTTPDSALPGTALKVLTGGIVPDGTDAVVPFEKASVDGEIVRFFSPVSEGSCIRKAGSDIQKGEVIITGNTIINPCEAALLAYAGIHSVEILHHPSIAILAVGNELCDPSQKNECGLIPADNLILMHSLCQQCGISNVTISPCANSPHDISEAIQKNLTNDLIITTGGTGPGNRDFVFNSVLEAGGTPLFKGLAMHPAKSIFAFSLESTTVVGLPGPPSAVNLSFHVVIKPIINLLMGLPVHPELNTAILQDKIKGANGREKLRPCLISQQNGSLFADPLNSGPASFRKIMTESNGIIILPPDCGELEAGKIVSVMLC